MAKTKTGRVISNLSEFELKEVFTKKPLEAGDPVVLALLKEAVKSGKGGEVRALGSSGRRISLGRS